MATVQTIYDYLTDNNKGSMLLRIELFKRDRTQDSLIWLMTSIELLKQINRIWLERKIF